MLLLLWVFFFVWFVWALWHNILRVVYKVARLFGFEIDPDEILVLQVMKATDIGTKKILNNIDREMRDGFVITKRDFSD